MAKAYPYTKVEQGFDQKTFDSFYYVTVHQKGKKKAYLVNDGELLTYTDRVAAEMSAHSVQERMRAKTND